jgi:hypothetical protein
VSPRPAPPEHEALTRVAAEQWTPGWPAEPALPRALGPASSGPAGAESAEGLVRRGWRGVVAIPRFSVARLAFPIAVAVLSRLYSGLLLAIVPLLQSDSHIPRISGYHDTLLQWDGQWYLMIANTGYHAAPIQAGPFGGRHDFAFFPAWPTVLRWFHTLGIQPADVAAPLANVLFVVAAVLMFLVLEPALGRTAARWGIVLLAFSPAAFVLSLAYSEPLFLVLVATSFLLSKSHLRPIAAAAAMLTRVTGVGLAIGAAAAWWHNRRDWTALATVVAVGLTFAGWWTFIWVLTGDPLGWLNGSPKWSYQLGVPAIWDTVSNLASPGFLEVVYATIMFGASILLVRRNSELGLFSVVAIGLSMLGAPVSSMPRHAMVAFPAFGFLADRLGPRWSLALTVVFAAFEANAVWLSFVVNRPLAP